MEDLPVSRAQSGDREAMERVLASVAPAIRRFAMRMCRNEADADDVLQDALLSIATHLPDFEGRSSLSSWAFTLARTACSRRRRGLKNQPVEPDTALAARATDTAGPEDLAASLETSTLVTRALDDLPDEHKEVLLLRDAEGLTAPEAAAVLGISVDALKSRLHRARAALRTALAPFIERGAPARGTSCPDVVAALSRKLEDELDAPTCAAMERHVAGCGGCARACDALKEALHACRTTPSRDVPAHVQRRVKTAVEAWLQERRES